MTSSGARVSIPANWRKMVSDIREVAGNHSEDEIYEMLQECNMNPDETAQKLFYQDTFHEVKKKRDKRKENTRETADPRWKPVVSGRGSRGSFSSRYIPSVATRNATSGKGNGVKKGPEKGNNSITPNTDNKDAGYRSVPLMANNTSNVDHQLFGNDCVSSSEAGNASETSKTGYTKLASSGVKNGSASGRPKPASDPLLSTKTEFPVSGVYEADLDPVLVPSHNKCNPGDVGTIQRVIGSQRTVIEATIKKSASCNLSGSELSSTSERRSSGTPSSYYGQGKAHAKPQASEANKQPDASQVTHSFLPTGSTSSRPPSHSQQLGGQQKVVLNKEWKPKSTQTNHQASGIPRASELPVAVEALPEPSTASHSVMSEDATSDIEKSLDKLHSSDRQHVIIPNHLQVPEYERHGLSFGSFDVSFKLNMVFANGPESESPKSPSESSQDIEESAEQLSSSIHTSSSVAQETDYTDHQPLSSQKPGNYSSAEDGISSITASQECDQSKIESSMTTEVPQYSVVQTTPSYATLELVPPMLGSQFAPLENSETQSQGTASVQSFVVQQPFDPTTSYYTQLYRPAADVDGRFSPFLASGGAPKYNGNIALLPGQTGQAPQESGNPVFISTAGSAPISPQATSVMQNSVAIPQQSLPFFRQPAGLHISHYPPNYIPYSQYYSPFYVPPPALHHFLGSAGFPQQVPAGSVYPPPGVAATAAPVKYPFSQYNPGTNTGNSTLGGMPTGYGTYNLNSAGYTNATVSSSNSTSNEDLSSNQFKENNIYVPGQQQSEGSAVWIQPHGRDISSSFYRISPQGQHMTFAPTQAGHDAYSGIYHPTPTVAAAPVHPLLQQSQTVAGAVEMVAPPSGVYQQAQRSQVNWANNY